MVSLNKSQASAALTFAFASSLDKKERISDSVAGGVRFEHLRQMGTPPL